VAKDRAEGSTAGREEGQRGGQETAVNGKSENP